MEQKLRKMQEKLLIGGVTIQDRTSHQEKVASKPITRYINVSFVSSKLSKSDVNLPSKD